MASPRKSSAEIWRRKTTKVALASHFENSVLGSTAKGRDGVSADAFNRNARSNIIALNHAVRAGSHKFAPYSLILKSKGAKKYPREIALPVVRDRVLLRAMAETLNSIEPACSMELAQAKVARVIEAMESGRFTHFIKLDVKDFYPQIKHEWLQAALKRTLKRDELVDLFMAAVRTPSLAQGEQRRDQKNTRGVPQGLAISNGLAELAVHHVDHAFAQDETTAYFRYVDDILILTVGDRTSEAATTVRAALSLSGLEAHDASSGKDKLANGKVSDEFDFLGYRFRWPRLTVRDSSINRLEASLARSFTRFKYARNGPARTADWENRCVQKLEWHLNLIISGCVFEGNRLGWLAYFSQIRHHQLLQHLDQIVSNLVRRFGVSAFEPKTFVQSYRLAASRRPDESGFVPNFDVVSVEEMQRILVQIFFVPIAEVAVMSEEQVEARFKRKIRGVVVELERDVFSGYS